MTMHSMPDTIEDVSELLLDIDRRLDFIEGIRGGGLSHSKLKDTEDHNQYLKSDGSVQMRNSLDMGLSSITNSGNRVLNIDIFSGDVLLDEGTNTLEVNNVNYGVVGGLTAGSIPFADSYGFLTEDNANLTWNDTDNILNVPAIQFDTSASQTMVEGLMRWNDDDKTLNVGMPGGEVIMQIGQEMYIPGRVKNETGGTLVNGTVVFINGVSGGKSTVAKADASTEALSFKTIGLVTEDITNTNLGHVTTFGLVRGSAGQPVDTSGFATGDVLYLSEVAGEFTNVKPASPAHAVTIGCVRAVSATVGEIMVHITNGFEFYELHDVDDGLITPTDKGILYWDDAAKIWKQTAKVLWDETGSKLTINNALDLSDGNITNVGDISLDTISADASTINITALLGLNQATPTAMFHIVPNSVTEEGIQIVGPGSYSGDYVNIKDSAGNEQFVLNANGLMEVEVQAAAREMIAIFTVSDDADNYFAIENGGSTVGSFNPTCVGYSNKTSSPGLNIRGTIDSTADSGTVAALHLDGFLSDNTPLVTRPVFKIRNFGNVILQGDANLNLRMPNDNQKLLIGAGQDASIYYNNTDMIIDPKEVGTGLLRVLGGAVFNQDLEDVDFIIGGDTEANLFRVDAGTDEVRMGDWDTNYMAVESDGDINFVGGAGLQYGCVNYHGAGVDTVLAAQDTFYQITAFDNNSQSNGDVTPDHTNDHITVGKKGDYQIFIGVSGRSAASSDYEVSVFINDGDTRLTPISVHMTTAVAGRVQTASMLCFAPLSANDTVEVWVQRTDGGAVAKTFTVDHIVLNVEQIGG